MNFSYPETDVAAALGLSAEAVRVHRSAVLSAGLDFDKRGKRLCYSQRGVLNLAAGLGLTEESALEFMAKLDIGATKNISPGVSAVTDSPAPGPSAEPGPIWARVHRHFINVRQVAICLESSGAIERCRVKHSGHLKPGERIRVRPSAQADDTFYVLDQREKIP
jgi:hypothetical protein